MDYKKIWKKKAKMGKTFAVACAVFFVATTVTSTGAATTTATSSMTMTGQCEPFTGH